MAPSVVRVKVTADGCYCFVGCRGNTPKTIMAIHLDKFRHEKDNDDDDNLQNNTALHAYIFSVSATTIGFAGVGSDSNLKLITFPNNQHSQHTAESVQKVIPNTSDISYIKGDFAYGYATAGRFYRLALSSTFLVMVMIMMWMDMADPTQHRDSFDLVVDAARKNSRSIGFVEHICATDDLSSWNVEISNVYPQFPLHSINRLERLFLHYIQWDLYISGSVYAKYYFALRSLTEKKDFRRRYNYTIKIDPPNSKRLEERSAAVKNELYSRSV
ncbi:hypothetical protein DYB28_004994 [Aphanomyces astaci]|uniref:Uncharacterized protein n=1 Tax=Aphanomyces astaci TaxID=112090 RepID=A0A9X8DXP4_APHAT|nr:hypothetical protein DYB28_004994 [Aphanomyces astaci]